jgi:hypothetical protein
MSPEVDWRILDHVPNTPAEPASLIQCSQAMVAVDRLPQFDGTLIYGPPFRSIVPRGIGSLPEVKVIARDS